MCPFFPFTKTGPIFIFTFLDQLTEFGGFAFIFKHFTPIEPMFDMIALGDNLCMIPLPDWIGEFYYIYLPPSGHTEHANARLPS